MILVLSWIDCRGKMRVVLISVSLFCIFPDLTVS